MSDPLPTGDSVSSHKVRYRFYIPDSQWLIDTFYGEIMDAITGLVWEQRGAVTPDDAAQAMLDTWFTIMPDFVQIGLILPFAGSVPPSPDLIPCDGRALPVLDYPDLFNVIGFTYSSQEGENFHVPDLRGRVMMGVGSGDGLTTRTLGQNLGEESHVLSVGELATHNHSAIPHAHSEIIATATLINGGIEAPAASAIPSVGSTGLADINIGDSGGGDAHNNIQPSLVCNYVIVAR